MCLACRVFFYGAAARPREVIEDRLVRILVVNIRLAEPLAISVHHAIADPDAIPWQADEALNQGLMYIRWITEDDDVAVLWVLVGQETPTDWTSRRIGQFIYQ